GQTMRILKGQPKGIHRLALSADGRYLASAREEDVTVILWDSASGRRLHTLEHPTWVTGVAFTRNGQGLASGAWDGKARLWDTASGALIRTFSGHRGVVMMVAFSPDKIGRAHV